MSGGAEVEVVVATSLDGKISTPDRAPWRWSDPADRAWLLERMAAADLLVVGAGTIRSENPSLLVPRDAARARRDAGRPAQPARLVLSPSLSVAPDARIVTGDAAEVLVAARPDRVAGRRHDFPAAVRWIEWRGPLADVLREAVAVTRAERIACLGGSRTNAGLLEEDLVDRISLTISSFVIGAAGAPGPFDGRGFAPGAFPRFDLARTRRAGRDILLEYRRATDE